MRISQNFITQLSIYFLLTCLPLSISAEESNSSVRLQPLTKTGDFDFTYIYSFGFDACGDYSFGKHLREAIIAKVESCPFTEETKAKFYKEAALATNESLAGYTAFIFTKSPTKYIPKRDAHCNEQNKKPEEILLRENVAKYEAGKIKLIDILNTPSEELSNCQKASIKSFDVIPSRFSGTVSSGNKITPSNNALIPLNK